MSELNNRDAWGAEYERGWDAATNRIIDLLKNNTDLICALDDYWEYNGQYEFPTALIKGESDGMANTDLTKPIKLTALEWEQLNKALEGEK